MNSLANTEDFPAGRGVAVNREMMVQADEPCIRLVTAWDGYYFQTKVGGYNHACELPAVDVAGRNRDSDEVFGKPLNVYPDENSLVRDGVRYVAEKALDRGCEGCKSITNCEDIVSSDACAIINGIHCSKNARKDGLDIKWVIATQPRAMTAVEIAKRYGQPHLKVGTFDIKGYAFQYVRLPRSEKLVVWQDTSWCHCLGVGLCGICLIDDLCEDVSRSPWFMPMVDADGNVTEVRCG